MQLGIRSSGGGFTSPGWLGSAHGTESAATVTIDGASLTDFDKSIPSGIPLTVGEDGKYEPVSAVGDTLAGFLLTRQDFDGDGDVVAPMIERGKVRVDRLPEEAFDISTLTTPNPLFILEVLPPVPGEDEGEETPPSPPPAPDAWEAEKEYSLNEVVTLGAGTVQATTR